MLAFVMAIGQAWPNASGGLDAQGDASVAEAVRRLARTG